MTRLNTIIVLALLLTAALPADTTPPRATQAALPQPVLGDLGRRLAIRAEADSWAALLKKVKPALAWGGRDMMWIGKDERVNPTFTLDRAYVYKPTNKPVRWVLLTYQDGPCDRAWLAFGTSYWRAVAKLHEKVPQTRHRLGNYAVVKSTHPKGGTVYEIGWESTMGTGSGLVVDERRLFVLRDAKGKWRRIGEGPVCTSGKMGHARAYGYTLRSKVVWTGKRDAPVRIELVQTRRRTEWITSDDDPGTVAKRDRIEYRDAVLAGALPTKLRWTAERPYMLAERSDTFEGIVGHLAAWTIGWDTNRGDDRQIILKTWKEGLARLNPRLPPGEIPRGTRISLLSYAETIEHLDKRRRAATQATTQPVKGVKWSKTVNGLQVRLEATRYSTRRLGLQLHIRLRKTPDSGWLAISLANIHWHIVDANGQAAKPHRVAAGRKPDWIIPEADGRRWRVVSPALGWKNGLIHIHGVVWKLRPGKYTMRATLFAAPGEPPKGRQKAWAGRIELPAVKFEVIAEVSDEQLKASVGKIRAARPGKREGMWLALARLVNPGMTVRRMKIALPPAGGIPALTLYNGAAFFMRYSLDGKFVAEASGIVQAVGDDGMVLTRRPRVRRLGLEPIRTTRPAG